MQMAFLSLGQHATLIQVPKLTISTTGWSTFPPFLPLPTQGGQRSCFYSCLFVNKTQKLVDGFGRNLVGVGGTLGM